MPFSILASVLFGLVHPMAKVILEKSLGFLDFCLLYVLIRLIFQLVIALKLKPKLAVDKSLFFVLFGVGIAGTVLILSEYIGIAMGQPVPTVSFLVYTNSLWLLPMAIYINQEQIDRADILKLGFGLVGILFLVSDRLKDLKISPMGIVGPLLASFCIALWVSLSNKARKMGASSWTISIYYDLFAFVALLLVKMIFGGGYKDVFSFVPWLSDFNNLALIVFYSVGVGLIPNILFYWAGDKLPAFIGGLALLIEPVMATAISTFLWPEQLHTQFLIGGLAILLANVPVDYFKKFGKLLKTKSSFLLKTPLLIFLVLSVATFVNQKMALAKTLVIFEMVPSDQKDYTVNNELKQIHLATDLFEKDFALDIKKCNLKIERQITHGSELDLISAVRAVSEKSATEKTVLVGLSRSNFARVAAKATIGSSLEVISIGAATSNLREINSKFSSIVAPWSSQWSAVYGAMKEKGCNIKNSMGIFDMNDHLSHLFRGGFTDVFGTATTRSIKTWTINSTEFSGIQCVFMGVNFSTAEKFFWEFLKINHGINIFGVGDWNYYRNEIDVVVKNAHMANWLITIPTGWTPTINARSQEFAKKMKQKFENTPSPISAYTYDAAGVALGQICGGNHSKQLLPPVNIKSRLLRSYEGVAASGNFLSKINIIQINPRAGIK